MPITCNVCDGTGFKNLHQITEEEYGQDVPDLTDEDEILKWIASHDNHDISVCDCCGDGGTWYGFPGEHYNREDPPGNDGPYASNGGLCKCH